MNKNLCFILVLAIVSISLCEVAPFMGQNGNTIVGMSASGLPIFQAPTGDVLYPIPSLENPNVAEWVPIFDFITKSSIVDIYENGIPVFQLPNGDLVQFDIKQRSSTKFKDFESIVSPHKQQLPAQNVPPPPLGQYHSEKKDSPQKKDSEWKPGGKKAKIPSNKPQTNIADEFQQKLMDKLQQNENEVSLQLPGGTLISETCYVPATRSSCAPHFIISGAMKSGTTSLFSYLLNHPRILPLVDSPKLNGAPVIADKEVRFFTDPTFSSMVSSLGAQSALNAYLEVFPEISPSSGMITGESSPMYICQKGVATRVKEFLPHVKNIILLRDPVDRIYSEHWFKLDLVRNNLPIKTQLDLFEQCTKQEMNLLRYCNTITGSLEDAECYFNTLRKVRRLSADNELCLPGGLYDGLCPENEQMSYNTCNLLGVKNSIYVLQLKEWLDAFDSSQLLILPSETFYSNPVETLKNVTDYLGVGDEYFDWTFIKDKAYNIKSDSALPSKLVMSEGDTTSLTEKYPPLNPHLRKELQDFFAPFNKQLAELLNIPDFWDY